VQHARLAPRQVRLQIYSMTCNWPLRLRSLVTVKHVAMSSLYLRRLAPLRPNRPLKGAAQRAVVLQGSWCIHHTSPSVATMSLMMSNITGVR